ncbi:HEPN domain-containing protein [Chryseobacterium sp. Hurlbut01]|uniref:HEPN domain-containing protein n=1 Tax=Chryseobacterium sp. Hurlbut01 TaxID=1681828 RepID=UPI00067DC729|nr:HEPN domain-containing protein [Chryseobacterium sp. Hurlbut01]KNB61190.1 hypothetical protein AC804_11465 [Chryseobacterium sp. Hurlbut01]
MSTIIQWFIPCYFNTDDGNNDEICIDITDDIKTIFSKNLAEKKVEFSYNYNLQFFKPNSFLSVKIYILPRFTSGYANENRLTEYIENNSNKIYSYFKVDSGFKNWHYALGTVRIETVIKENYHLPSRNEIKEFNFKSDFVGDYHKFVSLNKEILAIFLASLHLTFPTKSIMGWNDNPINDGILHFSSNQRHFFESLKTNQGMHHVLITKSRLNDLKQNLSGIADVWDSNLWSLKRYLIAVKSNQIDMDNLLDLLYALEGLFDKNTSADFIKTFCSLRLGNDKIEAHKIKSTLDSAFKIRNEIAHGAQHYRGYEKIKINGKEVLSQELYWDLKFIVSQILILAIIKLLKNKDMKNLNFKIDDLFDIVYKK